MTNITWNKITDINQINKERESNLKIELIISNCIIKDIIVVTFIPRLMFYQNVMKFLLRLYEMIKWVWYKGASVKVLS